MAIPAHTPVIIAVGQVTESVPDDLTQASSNVDLAEKAVRAAIADSKVKALAEQVDTVVAVRTFADSSPGHYPTPGS